ncbi:MAG: hypothetical protein H6917_04955 [Novosphingobium sp.]|nr:hypothetical protein [Novosphingobium sp.]MCP5401721.1 hypothetical protein [Novosphingobium sp.]
MIAKVCEAAFGKPLVTNVLRGQVIEAIIALALEPEWTWCSADYASWDFERDDGLRMEVKQSAYRQSWKTDPNAKISPGFDVKARKGRWEGSTFIAEPGRAAHLYVLAYHDIRDDSADHRDPAQWSFFVIPTPEIPPVARIGLGSVKRLTEPVSILDLRDHVSTVARRCRP